jgi:hypothetical protein
MAKSNRCVTCFQPRNVIIATKHGSSTTIRWMIDSLDVVKGLLAELLLRIPVDYNITYGRTVIARFDTKLIFDNDGHGIF